MSERLLVPGVVDVVLVDDDGRAVVETGPLADVPPADLTAWDETVWIAPRAEAPDLDLSAAPHVAQRLARARWERLDAKETAARLGAAPGVLRLDPRRDGDARITWLRPDGTRIAVDTSLWALWSGVLGPADADPDGWERRRVECVPVAERVVHAISDGVISLRDVDLALWAAGLDPELLPFEEAVLAEIDARAEGQAAVAAALVAALEGATADVDVDGLGTVRRVVNPAFTVPTSEGEIDVPETVSWVVDGVTDWEPEAAAARREARFAVWRGRVKAAKEAGRRRERRVWITIGVLMALGVAAGVLGWLAS